MTKYIKVVDHTGKNDAMGYHSVNDDFELPLSTKNETFVYVEESEAREKHPDLFGGAKAAKGKKSDEEKSK